MAQMIGQLQVQENIQIAIPAGATLKVIQVVDGVETELYNGVVPAGKNFDGAVAVYGAVKDN